MGISGAIGAASGPGNSEAREVIAALDAATAFQVPEGDPDALYRDRERIESALWVA